MRRSHLIYLLVAALAIVGTVSCGNTGGGNNNKGCKVADDCSEGQVCRKGACITSCEKDSDCSDADGDTCTLGGLCLTSCDKNGGKCGDGMTCEKTTKTCWPKGTKFGECMLDQDCEGNEYCGDGVCLLAQCEKHADCAGGNICDIIQGADTGTCRSGCLPGEDMCEDGETCNETTNICESIGCTMTSCGEFQKCDKEQSPPACIYTGACDGDTVCAAYADDIEADVPYICESGQCEKKPECMADSDCSDDEICIKHDKERNECTSGCRCTENCDRDCPAGKICTENNQCVSGCKSHDECKKKGDFDFCIDGQCRKECTSPNDCQVEGLTCRGDGQGHAICQHCTKDNQCPATKFCDKTKGTTPSKEMNSGVGLCEDIPPACPKDGYGDNHDETQPYEIKSFPFDSSMSMKPVYCRNPDTQPAYKKNGDEWWKLPASKAKTGKVIDVTMTYDNSVGNLDIVLKNSTGQTLVKSNLPPGSGTGKDNGKERIVYGIDAGTDFLIQVRGSITEKKAEYGFKVDIRDPKMCTKDGLEENDSCMNAKKLPVKNTKTGLNVCGDDKDFFTLDAKSNQIVKAVVQGVPDNLGDVDLVLYDSNCKVLKQVTEESGGKMEIRYSTKSAEKLRLEVRVARGVGYVDYDVRWVQSPNMCADKYEVNEKCPDQAKQLPRTTMNTTYGNLSVCTDKDYYAINLLPSDEIVLQARYNIKKAQGKLQFNLFGPNSCNINITAGTPTKMGDKRFLDIKYKVPPGGGGTYYIFAERAQGVGNIPYEFDVKINTGPSCSDDGYEKNDSQSGATMLSKSSITSNGKDAAINGLKICDMNEDWYCVNLNNGDDVKWEVRFQNAAGNIDAFLIDPNGKQQKAGTSNNDKETVSYKAQTSGKHCLKVAGKTPVRNEYRILSWVNGKGPNDPNCPDAYENNDSCSGTSMCQAATLPANKTQTGLLSCSGDKDWYKTCVNPGQTLTVEAKFKHTNGNIDMYLWEETGDIGNSFKAVSKGQTFNNNEKVSDFSNKKQCYYYMVENAFGKNSYELDVKASSAKSCTDDDSEQNDSPGAAASVSAPGIVPGRNKCENDVDWYKFNLPANKKFEAYIPHKVKDADLDLTLYDGCGSGRSVVGTPSTSQTDNEKLTATPNSSGTHCLKVDTKGKARIKYELLLYVDQNGNGSFDTGEGPADRKCPDAFEDNDQESEAASVGVSTYKNLNLCNELQNRDEDLFKVFVPSGATITTKTQNTNPSTNIDTNLYRGSVGFSTRVATASGSMPNNTISHKNSQSGSTYYVKVFAQSGASNFDKQYYDLDISLAFSGSCSEDSLTNNHHSKSNAVSSSNFTAKDYDMSSGLMLCDNTEDWFTVDPSSSGPSTFALEHRKALGEIELQLQDASGTIIASGQSTFNGNVKMISGQNLSASKTYYLRVFPKNGALIRNAYDLWAAFGGNTPSEPNCPDMFERNDEQSTDVAYQLQTNNGSAQAAEPIACGTEEDWYRVGLTSGTKYHFDTFFNHSSSSDLAIEVRNDTGTVVNNISFGSHSGNDDEQGTFTAGSTGTYYFGVKNTKSGEAPYPMQIIKDGAYSSHSACPEDQNEPNGSAFAATQLPQGSGIYALALCSQSGSTEQDVFKVKSKNGGSMTVEVFFDSGNGNLGGHFFVNGSNRQSLSQSGNHLSASKSGLSAGDTLEIHVGGPASATVPYFLKITD